MTCGVQEAVVTAIRSTRERRSRQPIFESIQGTRKVLCQQVVEGELQRKYKRYQRPFAFISPISIYNSPPDSFQGCTASVTSGPSDARQVSDPIPVFIPFTVHNSLQRMSA